MTVNQRIIAICKVYHLSQADVVRKTGLSKTKINRIFNNRINLSIKDLQALSVGLNINIDNFIKSDNLFDILLNGYIDAQEEIKLLKGNK